MQDTVTNKKEFQDNSVYKFGVLKNAKTALRVKNPMFDQNFPSLIKKGSYFKELKCNDFLDYIQKNPDNLKSGEYHCYVEGIGDSQVAQFEYFGSGNCTNTKGLNDNISQPPTPKNDLDANRFLEMLEKNSSQQYNTIEQSYKSTIDELKERLASQKETIDKLMESATTGATGGNSSHFVDIIREIQAEKVRLLETTQKEKSDLLESLNSDKAEIRRTAEQREADLRAAFESKLKDYEEKIDDLEIEKGDLVSKVAQLEADIKVLNEVQLEKDNLETQLSERMSGLDDLKTQIESNNTFMGVLNNHGDKIIPAVQAMVGLISEALAAKKNPPPPQNYYPPQNGYDPNQWQYPQVQNSQAYPQNYPQPQQVQQQPQPAAEYSENPGEADMKAEIRNGLLRQGFKPEQLTEEVVNAAYLEYMNSDNQAAQEVTDYANTQQTEEEPSAGMRGLRRDRRKVG